MKENSSLWARTIYWEGVRRLYKFQPARKDKLVSVREDLIQELNLILSKIIESFEDDN